VIHVTVARSTVYLSVSMSVTLVHLTKAIGQDEMPFVRDTRVVPSHTVLEFSYGKGRFAGRNSQFATMPLFGKFMAVVTFTGSSAVSG